MKISIKTILPRKKKFSGVAHLFTDMGRTWCGVEWYRDGVPDPPLYFDGKFKWCDKCVKVNSRIYPERDMSYWKKYYIELHQCSNNLESCKEIPEPVCPEVEVKPEPQEETNPNRIPY